MPHVAQLNAKENSLEHSRDQVIDAARRHIEEVERAAVRAIAASKNTTIEVEEEEQPEATEDVREQIETVVANSLPRYHTMICSIRSGDRSISRDEMESILRFAIDYFKVDAKELGDAAEGNVVSTDTEMKWLASVSDDDLWCFLMSQRIIGPLAKPDARTVRAAVEKAQSVDQLERIHDAVVGTPTDPRAFRSPEELAWITAIQKSVAAGAAYD